MPFWEIIKDDDNNMFQILGISSNDQELINKVAMMQDVGMSVTCEIISNKYDREQIIDEYNRRLNYQEDASLLDKLKSQYNAKKNK